mgnify:CR=1 FL=1
MHVLRTADKARQGLTVAGLGEAGHVLRAAPLRRAVAVGVGDDEEPPPQETYINIVNKLILKIRNNLEIPDAVVFIFFPLFILRLIPVKDRSF